MRFLPSPTDKPLDERQIEKEYLRSQRFALRLLGHWPQDELLSLSVLPLAILSYLILALAVAVEVSYLYLHLDTLRLALDALCPIMTKSITIIKFTMLLHTRSKVTKMLNDIKQKWINDKTQGSNYENLRATRIAVITAMILICFSNTAATLYNLRPLAVMLRQYYTGKEIIRSMPFLSVYPFDEYADPIYAFTYILNGISGNICGLGLAGVDGIFVVICLHISAHFRILKRSFEQLTPDHQNAENERSIQYSETENDELYKKLKELIRRHEEIIQSNEHMVKVFLGIIFSHFVSAALSLCCVSVNLLLAKDEEFILYSCYGIAAVTQLLIYCASGTVLNTDSFNVGEAVYFLDWYKMDTRNQRLAQLIILRAQKPCGIVVPFFESSLQTFTTIMQASGSYIALFRNFLE